jgi:CRP/FNR family cyclic AMP-dependent transcriptional regulator
LPTLLIGALDPTGVSKDTLWMKGRKMDILALIDPMPLFKNFTGEEKKLLIDAKPPVREFEKGETIIAEGDTGKSLFIILKGSVLITKVSEESNIRLSKISAGDIFGEMSFFSNTPRRTNVVANDPVCVMEIDQAFFEKMTLQMSTKIKDYLIGLLIARLDSMNENIVRISKWMRG